MAGLTRRTKYGYGVGHVLNDLCSAMWFTYLLIYFHHVLLFNNTLAGVVLLIGQVADALSTPFVGHEADRTDDLPFCARYGRRKSWHLTGTICVLGAFPFIFLGCLGCSTSSDWAQVIYYAPFVILFQFGWASTQISHLALIPSLTQDPHDRTELNALRYGFTVMSNITVYLITWLVMGLDSSDSTEKGLGPDDAGKFRIIVFTVLAIGLVFSFLFHFLVKENHNPEYLNMPDGECAIDKEIDTGKCSTVSQCNAAEAAPLPPGRTLVRARDWLKNRQFYQVALLYMGTRLYCNLTQAYIPIYLQDTLKLPEEAVAYIPLVMYISGFLTSLTLKMLNKLVGRKVSYMMGCVLGGSACICVWFGEGDLFCHYLLYGVAAMMGAGASIMLVTSLSLTADLIGPCVESGAFVYGAMSFTDKLSNGIAVMLIQNFNPCTGSPFGNCCPKCQQYFRGVVSYWCGGAALIGFVAILTLLPSKMGNTSRGKEPAENSVAAAASEEDLGNIIVVPEEPPSVSIRSPFDNSSSQVHTVAAEHHGDLRSRVISLSSDNEENESNA